MLPADERAAAADFAPHAVALVAARTVDPDVYDTLGLAGGYEAATANPHHQARIVDGLAKLTTFLTELGVIDADRRPQWEALGLVGSADPVAA